MKKIMLTLVLVLAAFVGMNAEKVTTRLYIPDMECNNCKAKAEKSLTYIKGVKDLKIDLEQRMVTITYDDAKTTIAKIQEQLLKDTKFASKEVKQGCSGCKNGQCTGACKGHEHAHGEACNHQHGEACQGHGHDHSQCQGHKEGEHKCSGECKGHEHAHGEACNHQHGEACQGHGHDHSQCQGHKEGEHKCSGECKGHEHAQGQPCNHQHGEACQGHGHSQCQGHKEGEHKCSGECKEQPKKAPAKK